MSDQMPDEVLIDRRMHAWRPEDWHLLDRREGQIKYIRADLYEQAGEFDHQGIDPADLGQHFTDAMQALTTRNAVSKAACAQLIAEQAQRAEQAEAKRDRLRGEACSALNAFSRERDKVHVMQSDIEVLRGELDRLRAAVSEAKRRIGIYMDDEWSYIETLEMGRFVLDAFHGLQEALDHD